MRGNLMREIQQYLIDVPPLIFKSTTMFAMLVLLAHFFGCFWNFFDKVMCENAGAEFNLYVGSAPWDPNVRADHEYTEFWEKYVKGVYWAFTTMTTVGFGDITPTTDAGRFIASIMMLLGWGTLAVPTGIVSSEFTVDRLSYHPKQRTCDDCDYIEPDHTANFCRSCGAPSTRGRLPTTLTLCCSTARLHSAS